MNLRYSWRAVWSFAKCLFWDISQGVEEWLWFPPKALTSLTWMLCCPSTISRQQPGLNLSSEILIMPFYHEKLFKCPSIVLKIQSKLWTGILKFLPTHLMDISPASSLSPPLPTRASFHSPDPRTCSPDPSEALIPATSSAWPAPSQLFLRFAYLHPSALWSTALGQPCWKWPSPGYTPFHQLGYLLYTLSPSITTAQGLTPKSVAYPWT